MAKGHKTGGRHKGTPNKATVARQAAIAASGLTPLDYMLRVMRDPDEDPKRRDAMAVAAAPYVHPRLSAAAVAVDDRRSLSEISTAELIAALRAGGDDEGAREAEEDLAHRDPLPH